MLFIIPLDPFLGRIQYLLVMCVLRHKDTKKREKKRKSLKKKKKKRTKRKAYLTYKQETVSNNVKLLFLLFCYI